jgi:4,5-DOPA dioxygenase extradiol
MYTLGLKGNNDAISFFNDKAVGGSLTMTSVKLG